MSKKYVLGVFDDDDKLVHAIGSIRKEGIAIHDVLTPFPVHGIEDALGWKRSRIPVVGFIFGCCGTLTAFFGMAWVFNIDWPINFGGKPFLPLPAFMPIIFELTVLFAAIGMFVVFLASSRLSPGMFKPILDVRATDDRFIMVFDAEKVKDAEKLRKILNDNGASEVNEKEVDK